MIRCSCGNALTYETDICEVCLPNGLAPSLTAPSANTGVMALVSAWESRADDHEKRADVANKNGDDLNFNRQDAYAYAARLHAKELREALIKGAY